MTEPWRQHFDATYADVDLSPDDAARYVFAAGWNAALTELMQRYRAMPLERDTRASFIVHLQQLMCVDPMEVADGADDD